MNEKVNIFENRVFQGMSGTYIIHTIFSQEEIGQALHYFLDDEYGMEPENLERLSEDDQQIIIHKFHNWFLQLDMCAVRLLEKITTLPNVNVQVQKRY